MSKNFFNYDDGDFVHTISDNTAIDSDDNLLIRMGDNMATDMVTGDLHFVSGWSDNEDEYIDGSRDYPCCHLIRNAPDRSLLL